MKPETEIKSLKRELNRLQRECDHFREAKVKWQAAYETALQARNEWEARFDELLVRVPKVVE